MSELFQNNNSMKKSLLFSTVASLLFFSISILSPAQNNKCATMKILEKRIAKDSSIKLRIEQGEIQTQKKIEALKQSKSLRQIITIPVVVHVLWNDPIENISDAQIQSQINILSEDFRLLNADSLPISHPFWYYTANTQIEFCLASRDPNGNATTGITRTHTDSISFTGEGNEKFSATGGKDNWDPTKYLNLWVCNLDSSGGTLGYAVFPADLATSPDLDGVVIRYEAFGDMGTAGMGSFTTNNLGRTATHEVGHWLNLYHIWGDDYCGDDLVADTRTAYEANFGCPAFPYNPNSICGTDADGEMFMNYMDYVDDHCMNMFTFGQSDRMYSALNIERVGLLTSMGCGTPNNIVENSFEASVSISPNPNNGIFVININTPNSKNINVNVVNVLGETIKTIHTVVGNGEQLDFSELCNGVYYLQINLGDRIVVKKVIITQ